MVWSTRLSPTQEALTPRCSIRLGAAHYEFFIRYRPIVWNRVQRRVCHVPLETPSRSTFRRRGFCSILVGLELVDNLTFRCLEAHRTSWWSPRGTGC